MTTHDESTPQDAIADVEADVPNDRRRFLTKGALAAAAAATGVVALSDQAGAADGGNMIIGGANAGSGGASLTSLTASRFQVSTPLSTFAIRGVHDAGTGVWGEAGSTGAAGIGVRGRNFSGGGKGVLGENAGSSGGTGVHGISEYGIGVLAEGGTTSIRAIGIYGKAPLGPSLFLEEGALSIPPSGSWAAGSFVQDAGHVWYCYKTGTGAAAKWVKLSGAPVILASSFRAYDSRVGFLPATAPKTKITDGVDRTGIDLVVNSSGQIPTGISAALINITATNTSAAGFFGVHKNGTAWPGTSTVNWSAANSTVANFAIVAVDTLSRIAVRGAGSADCIIDVIGFLP